MKLAVITDSTALLSSKTAQHPDTYVIDVPIILDGQVYIEGKNLDMNHFYEKMAQSTELPKTSQPSLTDLDQLLTALKKQGYTHVIGLFLSSGISGFWQNCQFLVEEHPDLVMAIPDSHITSAPLGHLVETTLLKASEGLSFEAILQGLRQQIQESTAFIVVDDLKHLVKGGRLSNSSALLGQVLAIKPILYFNQGKIEVFEKVRTHKKAINRLLVLLEDKLAQRDYALTILHTNAADQAEDFYNLLRATGYEGECHISPLSSAIAAHLGQGAIAFGISPRI